MLTTIFNAQFILCSVDDISFIVHVYYQHTPTKIDRRRKTRYVDHISEEMEISILLRKVEKMIQAVGDANSDRKLLIDQVEVELKANGIKADIYVKRKKKYNYTVDFNDPDWQEKLYDAMEDAAKKFFKEG